MHGLKIENETLEIQAKEREKMLRVLQQHQTTVINVKISSL